MIRTNLLRAAGQCPHPLSLTPSLSSGAKTSTSISLLSVTQTFPCIRRHIHCTPLKNAAPLYEVNLSEGHTSNTAALPPAPTDLLELYRGLVAAGRLNWDDEQVRCVMKVRLYQCLAGNSLLNPSLAAAPT